MIIFELDLDFKYPSTQQLNFIDELESIGIKLKSVSSASNVYFDNVEIDPSETITIANPVSGTHYFKNELGTQIKCVFIAKQSSINFQPNQPDMTDYYTKEETDEAIADAIAAIPEPEIPETNTIPQKSGTDGNMWLAYDPSGNMLSGFYTAVDPDDDGIAMYYETYLDKVPNGVYVLNKTVQPLFASMSEDTFTDNQTFNFPDTIIALASLNSDNQLLRNEVQHGEYSTVDGFVLRYESNINPLVVENVRGFLVPDNTLSNVNRSRLIVKNCGMLGDSNQFNGVKHLIVDGDINYITTLMFVQYADYADTFCQHITFIGKGILKSKIFEFDSDTLMDLMYDPAPSTRPLTIEFPDITFNEFAAWCNNNGIATANIYSELFNGSAIAKLVFKDQTINDVTQAKLDGSFAKVIFTLEDGTVLPVRNSADFNGAASIAKDSAVKIEIIDTSDIAELASANVFKDLGFLKVTEVKNFTNRIFAFNSALKNFYCNYLVTIPANIDIENVYHDGTLSAFMARSLFRGANFKNVYLTAITGLASVGQGHKQTEDCNFYYMGILCGIYSAFYNTVEWKNGFGS